MFALIDVNGMYASCEQAFRPDLANRAVAVLSNNDGNIVARNYLAKKAGLKMGDPYFKVRPIIERHNIAIFSSNYTLYASMSARFAAVVESLASHVEQYSIDELFVDCKGITAAMSLDAFGRQLREEVRRHTTLVCGVGIARTKTWPATGGVVALDDGARLKKLMSILPVAEVWGVGHRTEKALATMGIKTVLDLARADTRLIRKTFGVVLERTVRELRGEACFSLEENPPAKQQIVVSRSFGQRVETLTDMQQAVTGFAARAAEKLRNERQYCRVISVFIRTSPYSVRDTQYANQATEKLTVATQDSRTIIQAAQAALARIWREDIAYAKAGVMLADFSGKEAQLDLFDSATPSAGSEALMAVLDGINRRGKNQLFFAGQGIDNSFAMRRQMLSPDYTTDWRSIPIATIK